MKRSKHNLSYTHLLSCDLGELVPVGLTEVLPGDSMQMQSRILLRCAPMLAPAMHAVRVRVHHWFVPHRLVWDDWENFITGGPDGLDASIFPTRAGGSVAAGSLLNYLGVPVANPLPAFSALPLRGYQLIWNEYYRDQDLQAAVTVDTTSGGDTTTSLVLQNVAWEKDYFTSARPFEQKGPAVTIPLSGTGSVEFSETGTTPGVRTLERVSGGAGSNIAVIQAGTGGGDIVATANLTSAGVTVNDLREALAIQRFEEARAMYGSRYPEYLRALGVRSSDARLQRPEYLGGGRQVIQFSEVVQSAGDGANPVSTLRGHGIAALRGNRFRRFFEEHGYVFTLVSVIPKTIYMNGLFRTWNRRVKYDFWQRELEHIGQQAVLNKEIYALHTTPDGTFGWQDRYDEYRRSESRVSGEFSQTALNYWHFARLFTSDPALNSTFVSAVPPERPFAAPASDVLYMHVQNSIQARRLVSAKAIPRTF